MKSDIEKTIRRLLDSWSPNDRLEAISLLQKYAHELSNAAGLARIALQDDDFECRAEAMQLLLQIPELREDVIAIATTSKNPTERKIAFDALLDVYGEDINIYRLALGDEDPDIRFNALARMETILFCLPNSNYPESGLGCYWSPCAGMETNKQ